MNLATIRLIGWFSRNVAQLIFFVFLATLVLWAVGAVVLVVGCSPVHAQPQSQIQWPIASSSQAQDDLSVWLNPHGDVEQLNIVGLSTSDVANLNVAKTEIIGQRHPRLGMVYNEDDQAPLWCSWDGSAWAPCPFGARRVHWNAAEMDTAAPCTQVQELIAPAGPRQTLIQCTTDTDAIVDAEVDLPADSDSIDLRVDVFTVATDTDGIASIEAKCMCRGPGDTLDDTYGTVDSNLIVFTGSSGEEFVKKQFLIEDLVCNGTCLANDTLYIQMVLNVEETFTGVDDLRIENASAVY